MELESRKKAFEIILGCLLLLSVYLLSREGAKLVNLEMASQKTVVIDAGHGGEDPGKVGKSEVLEKDINLEIAKKLETYLQEKGIRVVMTRTEDKMLSNEISSNKKADDLKNRSELINGSDAVCAVSIHQNSYSDETIKGAQVFYFEDSKEGRILGETLQQALIDGVDSDNHRKAKGNATYYLLKKTQIPLVIVECGFLSNSEETNLLQNWDYQEKIVRAIGDGVIQYLEKGEAL